MIKKTTLPFIILIFASLNTNAQAIIGSWKGKIAFNSIDLGINMHAEKTKFGLNATMDSPDQGQYGIAADSIAFFNDTLIFTIASLKVRYVGVLKNETITGQFSQNGSPFPLTFTRMNPAEIKEAKSHILVYSYQTEEINIKNKRANVSLNGILSYPEKGNKFPLAILISGSGAQDKDCNLFGVKHFEIAADYLSKNGFAVFRYDDRQVGKSTGNFATSTTADFAEDTKTIVNQLAKHKKIDASKIGLIGHSEGAIIAFMTAANNPKIAYVISLGGPGLTGDSILILQTGLISKGSGQADSITENVLALNRAAYSLVRNAKNQDTLKKALTLLFEESTKANNPDTSSATKDFIIANVAQLTNPWVQYFIKNDPAPYLQKIKSPVLALNGQEDVQVPAIVNLQAIEYYVKKGGNYKITIKMYPKLNHLFQACITCQPSEYPSLKTSFSPQVLEEMRNWIKYTVE